MLFANLFHVGHVFSQNLTKSSLMMLLFLYFLVYLAMLSVAEVIYHWEAVLMDKLTVLWVMTVYFPISKIMGFPPTSHFCFRVMELWKLVILTCSFSIFQAPPMQSHDSRGSKSQVPQSSGHEFKSQYRGANSTAESQFMYNGWVTVCQLG